MKSVTMNHDRSKGYIHLHVTPSDTSLHSHTNENHSDRCALHAHQPLRCLEHLNEQNVIPLSYLH